MAYTGWNPPAATCRNCHRAALPHSHACGPECAEVLRQSDLMHDARNLAQAALSKDESDPLVGFAWLHYQYRPTPTTAERELIDTAAELMRQECTDAEWRVWEALRRDPRVTSLATAMEAKHTYTRDRADSVRAAA